MCLEYFIYDFLWFFMNFYDLSPLLIMLRLCSHIKVVSGYNNIFHLRFCKAFSPLLMLRLPSQQPHVMGPQESPLKIVLHALNLSLKYASSTPTIRCVWSIICTYYRLFPFTIFLRFFMIFYDWSILLTSLLHNFAHDSSSSCTTLAFSS